MVNLRRVMIVFAVVLVIPWFRGQCQTKTDESVFRLVYAPRDKTIEILGGMTVPLSHEGITDFWLRGPGANVCLMVRMKDNFKVGVGVAAALFYFRRGAFG